MTISYAWLCDYLPVKPSPEKLSIILTSIGLEVEHMELRDPVKGGLAGLVVGEVLTCAPVPDSDKLKLTTVSIGQDTPLQIVCGAPNVAVGQKVIVATIGATLYPTQGEPFSIKKSKIRGVESQGMLCADDEIGTGLSHDGIRVLPAECLVGTPVREVLDIPPADYIYEIGLTPNRMDAMSHLGVARDVCAYLAHHEGLQDQAVWPQVELPKAQGGASPVKVYLDDASRCGRYAGLCIEGIQIAESPSWLKNRLEAIGVRPINNVVDITNYVLHECGQPLHAFDLSAIQGNEIHVKTLADKTPFVTLDGKTIELSADDLMINNAQEPMCMAGVYGGLHSGISETTQAMFLESAWFMNETVRKSSVKHGLRTEAAQRFEKGIDVTKIPYALHRAAQLILEIAGGRLMGEPIDIYPTPKVMLPIVLSLSKVRRLSGKDYSNESMKTILSRLGFEIEENSNEAWTVTPPTSKQDIEGLADVVEEIMRIDGLDAIPFPGTIRYTLPESGKPHPSNWKQHIASQLMGKGFFEIFTNSITNAAYYKEQEGLVQMMNSLSANLDTLRPSMIETGLEAVAYNLNRKNNHLLFFEFGKTYVQTKQEDGTWQFDEQEKLLLLATGNRRPQHFSEKPVAVDALFLKGILDELFVGLAMSYAYQEQGIQVLFQNQVIGLLHQVPAAQRKQFDIKQAVWAIELDWKRLQKGLDRRKVNFTELPRFPMVSRDLSMVLKKSVPYSELERVVKQAKVKRLQAMQLFDVFESEKIGIENQSLAVNFRFYDAQKTLTDTEIDSDMNTLMQALEKNLGAQIRSV
ncbi:MAG: phenylalanine--tRNA ligase subunit beta [Chitinophagaceae bacterium]